MMEKVEGPSVFTYFESLLTTISFLISLFLFSSLLLLSFLFLLLFSFSCHSLALTFHSLFCLNVT
jgi:hypothetical protein